LDSGFRACSRWNEGDVALSGGDLLAALEQDWPEAGLDEAQGREEPGRACADDGDGRPAGDVRVGKRRLFVRQAGLVGDGLGVQVDEDGATAGVDRAAQDAEGREALGGHAQRGGRSGFLARRVEASRGERARSSSARIGGSAWRRHGLRGPVLSPLPRLQAVFDEVAERGDGDEVSHVEVAVLDDDAEGLFKADDELQQADGVYAVRVDQGGVRLDVVGATCRKRRSTIICFSLASMVALSMAHSL
jgi:hypothetical protein